MIIEKGLLPYFQVSGQRREIIEDPLTKELTDTGRILDSRVRFECLRLPDAEKHATDVYKKEGIVCEIHELSP